MRMNIHQAAKAVGVARSTLYRDIQEGKVSVGKDGRGKPYVDVSELERAYGSVTLPDTSETVPNGQSKTPQKDNKDSALQSEFDLLREQIALLKDERDDLRRRLDEEAEERLDGSHRADAAVDRLDVTAQAVEEGLVAWDVVKR